MEKSDFKFELISNERANDCIAFANESYGKNDQPPRWEDYGDAIKEREVEQKLGVYYKIRMMGRDRSSGHWCVISLYYGEDGQRLKQSGNGQGFCPPFCGNDGDILESLF